jgi:hypothetical protein
MTIQLIFKAVVILYLNMHDVGGLWIPIVSEVSCICFQPYELLFIESNCIKYIEQLWFAFYTEVSCPIHRL